jgi:hypothetical protein
MFTLCLFDDTGGVHIVVRSLLSGLFAFILLTGGADLPLSKSLFCPRDSPSNSPPLGGGRRSSGGGGLCGDGGAWACNAALIRCAGAIGPPCAGDGVEGANAPLAASCCRIR